MLVLSRKPEERIIIRKDGVEIKLTVVQIGPNSVRLGFDADKSVEILRAELIETKPEKF